MRRLLFIMLLSTSAQANDFCANPPCPCFMGDPCHVEMPARDVICLPGFYIGSEANGVPICSDFPKEELQKNYSLSKKTILDFEKQIIENADAAQKEKVKVQQLEKRLNRCRQSRGRRC